MACHGGGFAIIVVGASKAERMARLREEQQRPICIQEIQSSSVGEAIEKFDEMFKSTIATQYTETVVGKLQKEVEKLQLDPDLCVSIEELVEKKNYSGVNAKTLQKTADKVKKYLKEEGNNADALFKHEGFISFLLKCLEDGSNNASLQFSTAWIMGEVLTRGSASTVRAIIDPETLAVSSVVKLLQSSDRTIYEKATSVIALLAKEESTREQLITNRTAPSLLGRLTTLLKGKKPSQEFVKDVADIITELVVDISNLRKLHKRISKTARTLYKMKKLSDGVYGIFIDARCCHPPPRLTKLALPVISAVLDLDNITDKVRLNMMQCLTTASTVLVDIQPLIDNGCCTKMVSVFSKTNPLPGELLYAVTSLGNIALSGGSALLAFLKSLKDTRGLENYWKGLKTDDEDGPRDYLAKPFINFLTELAGVIHRDLNGEGVDATIDSGIVDSLVHFIKDSEIPTEAVHHAIHMLQCMLTQLPVGRRDVAAHALVPVLAHLSGHQHCELGTLCLRILKNLIDGNSERRNEAMSYGALPTLLDMLEQQGVLEFSKIELILKCVRAMVSLTPRVARVFFEGVPKAIMTFFRNAEVSSNGNMEIALEILIEITAHYGSDGASYVVDANLIPDLISMAALVDTQGSKLGNMGLNSMKVLANICQYGSPEHRKELVVAGILEAFENVLASDSVDRRKLALICLDLFLTKEKTKLTGQERVEIKKLGPLVEAKMKVNALGTLVLSKTVYGKMMKVKDLK